MAFHSSTKVAAAAAFSGGTVVGGGGGAVVVVDRGGADVTGVVESVSGFGSSPPMKLITAQAAIPRMATTNTAPAMTMPHCRRFSASEKIGSAACRERAGT